MKNATHCKLCSGTGKIYISVPYGPVNDVKVRTRQVDCDAKDCRQGYVAKPGYRWEKCDGEAHSNPYIDSCGTCTPRWGWVLVKEG